MADVDASAGETASKVESAVAPIPLTDLIPFVPHDEMPDMLPEGIEIIYCPSCGLTPDFCSYGPKWEECRPWVLEHFPHYYPELAGLSLEDAKKRAAEVAGGKIKTHMLPGGKVKREKSPRVEVRKLQRSGGRKCVTTVNGLHMFDVKLDAAAKIFKKKFACGASVVNNAAQNLPDEIDIQGDIEDEIIDVIVANFPQITAKKISFLEDGKVKGGKKKA